MKRPLRKLTYTKKAVWLFYSILALCCAASIVFVQHNYNFYDRPIAKVITAESIDERTTNDVHGNKDTLVIQQLEAELKNGKQNGQSIELENTYSASGAYDHQYSVGDELFVSVSQEVTENGELRGEVVDLKRDRQVVWIAWLFIFTLLVIGRRRGLFSLLSFAVNVALLSFALDLYVKHFESGLLLIVSGCILLFTAISLLLVGGWNEKTFAAIIATLLSTFVSLGIAYAVIWAMGGNGLRYEEMQFLTRPYEVVFMAGLFIGSLGAIMDIAITISSSLFALFDQDPKISNQALRESGLDIGRDIMGTITSILFFAYLSGALPMLILYLKNATPLGFALSMNLSLEIARALAGGIGIVLAIPISLYVVLFYIHRRRASV